MLKRTCDKCGKNVEEYILITSNCDYNLQMTLYGKSEKVDFCNECKSSVFDFSFIKFVLETFCVFGARKLFAEAVKSEAVVNTLLEYSAQTRFAFY